MGTPVSGKLNLKDKVCHRPCESCKGAWRFKSVWIRSEIPHTTLSFRHRLVADDGIWFACTILKNVPGPSHAYDGMSKVAWGTIYSQTWPGNHLLGTITCRLRPGQGPTVKFYSIVNPPKTTTCQTLHFGPKWAFYTVFQPSNTTNQATNKGDILTW